VTGSLVRLQENGEMANVLYIGGCTRSGSTLLDRSLGQLPGFLSTGELGLLTTNGVQENRLCGCGARFLDCPFWTAVGHRAFGGWDSHDAQELVALHLRVDRHRYLPFIVLPVLSARFRRQLHRYVELLGQVYEALHEVAHVEVIIDSTKAPAYAFILRRVPGLKLRIVHLVRDSRGTAFSASKRFVVKDSVDREVFKHRYPPAVITLRWVIYHLLFDYLRILNGPEHLVRYEDFVRAPQTTLQRILSYLGTSMDESSLGFARPGVMELDVHHTLAGNDMRLSHGTMRVREDDEWRRSLNGRDRRLVTLLSWPFLKRWGYT
jgi:hypothetical protein